MAALLTVGFQAGRRAQAGGLRFAATVLATVAVSGSLMAVAAAHLTYEARESRAVARVPIVHQDGSPGQARLLWKGGFDVVRGRQFSLVIVSPLTADAPLPPGLSRWPGPGEVALSPALIQAGAAEDIADRYGRTAMQIGRDGLAGPDEKFAYLRPPADLVDPAGMVRVDGFGSVTDAAIGDVLFVKPEWMFHLLLALLGVLPAMVLLFVATRTGSQARDRRVALATTLGAQRRHRAVITCGEAGPAVLAGALPALLLLLIASRVDVRLPVVDYLLAAADLRAHFWLPAVSWAFGVLLVFAVLALLDGVAVSRSRRPRPLGTRRPPVRVAGLFPIMVLVAVQGPRLFEPGTPLFLLANYVGIIGTLLTVPAVIGLVVSVLGSGLATLGRRRALSGTMLAGRWLATNSGTVARIAAGIVAAIGLLIQAQVWFGFLGSPVQQAQRAHHRAGDSVQILYRPQEAPPQQLAALFRALSGTAEPMRLVMDPFTRRIQIIGTCPALSAVHLDCTGADHSISRTAAGRDVRLQSLMSAYAVDAATVTVRVGDPASTVTGPTLQSVVALVSPDGRPLSAARIERAAYRTMSGTTTAYPIGGSWLVGAAVNADQGRWLLLLGVLGVLVLTIACGISGLGEFTRWSRKLAPITVLAGNRRVFLTSAAWTVFLPVLAAGAIGIGIALWLALPIVNTGFSRFSTTLIQACGIAVAALAALLWLTAIRTASLQSRTWTPGGE